MKKNILLVIYFFSICLFSLSAQSNALLDKFLEQKKADFTTTAYLVLSASNNISIDATPEETLNILKKNNWGVSILNASEGIRFDDYSLLLMKAFHIPGGFMYSIFPNARYAAHEVVYKEFTADKFEPDHIMKPDEILRILNSVLEWKEGQS